MPPRWLRNETLHARCEDGGSCVMDYSMEKGMRISCSLATPTAGRVASLVCIVGGGGFGSASKGGGIAAARRSR